ncbi:hypothetical protein [Aquisalibacillus elongatus]|uniref:Uncharacterized protein n=1 Tax=Aquisalibacillus elongatus TaxID=485577 RepID=A0A3N5B6Y6_9BACI|nr:hypothetical protein [Aquisalibacillus elongatus]RPF53194.1 hypothetical protein EDC24_1690 [Aquisalibacillus elongatus]
MDNHLNQMKEEYKKRHQASFQEQSREQVFQKISAKHQPPSPRRSYIFRSGLTIIALLIIGFLILMNYHDQQSHPPMADHEFEEDIAIDDETDDATDQNEAFEGYVIDVQNEGVIVSNYEIRNKILLSENISNNIKIGDHIVYDKQTDKINVLNTTPVNESILPENSAIQKAIEHLGLNQSETTYYITNVAYIPEDRIWEVEFNHSTNGIETDTKVHIDDQTGSLATPTEPPSDVVSDYTFDYSRYGQQFKELEHDLRLALNSDWTSLYHLARQDYYNRKNIYHDVDFSYKLNGAAIEDGIVTIDFQPFEESLTTHEIGSFTDEMRRIVFKYDEVNQFILQFNGSRKSEDTPYEVAVNEPIERKDKYESFNESDNIRKAINAYSGTFRYLFRHHDNEKLVFESGQETLDFLTRTMSHDLAKQHFSHYISEVNGALILNTFNMPPVIDHQAPYETTELNEQTYQVEQIIQSEGGEQLLTYIIKNENYKWYVESIEIESQ